MRRFSQRNFSLVPAVEKPRSEFPMGFSHKTTLDAGYLVPVAGVEVLPGDTMAFTFSGVVRWLDLLRPVMDNLYIDYFAFFVPYRLVWEHWDNLIGQKDDPDDTREFVTPQVNIPRSSLQPQSIFTYMGLPYANQYSQAENLKVDSLELRAYNKIYNDWFRDENLQDRLPVPTGDGDDDASIFQLVRRGKRHDYFTSCLPWPQKGPQVNLPLGLSAPVMGNGQALGLTHSTSGGTSGFSAKLVSSGDYRVAGTTDCTLGMTRSETSQVVTPGMVYQQSQLGTSTPLYSVGVVKDGSQSGLIADLSAATASTVNQLREAFAIQRMFEKDARGGTRAVEIYQMHFGVRNPDARLQRSEYLGHASHLFNVSTVVQTSSALETSPQGNLTGNGYSYGSLNCFRSFMEFGVIIILASIRSDYTYQQGLHRKWFRRGRFDYYWPGLSHLGEQPVYSKEIYCDGSSADDDVFGYQERYAEYRYLPDRVSGYMNSFSSEPLDQWHMAQKFTGRPVLSSEFIVENPPISRVVAVQDRPAFMGDFNLRIHQASRVMPLFGVPGLLDHF